MKDLTHGSITSHIVSLAVPVAITMAAQIIYQLIDLYFVTTLGAVAIAGVSAANNAILVVTALMQILVTGTVAVVAQALGRKDHAGANIAFNQALALSVACGVAITVLFSALMRPYLRTVAADRAVVDAGLTFVHWAMASYALSLPMAVFSCALRSSGAMAPMVVSYALTVAINAFLAPVLIVGWLSGVPLGVQGAGLATSISVSIGIVFLGACFHRTQRHMRITPRLLRPDLHQWRRLLAIGAPASAEWILLCLSTAVTYYAIRNFGATVQAGFGIGWRALQFLLFPGMAIASAATPIVGQNFGARNADRVRETFRAVAVMEITLMLVIALLMQWHSVSLIGLFNADAMASDVGSSFLRLVSWSLVAQGLAYACSTIFQGLGNTVPVLAGSAARFVSFTALVVVLSGQNWFVVDHVWHALAASIVIQALVSTYLLRRQFRSPLPGTDDLKPAISSAARTRIICN